MDTQTQKPEHEKKPAPEICYIEQYTTRSLSHEGPYPGMAILSSPESQIVNVGSIPLRSPFRYPGGKTWLVPTIRRWLRSKPTTLPLLIEPFAGGAIVGLTAAFESLADHVLLVELDPEVAAIWRTLVNGDASGLAERIASIHLSPNSVKEVCAATTVNDHERAFRTIIKNRVNRGGIMAPGAGVSNLGKKGRGILSRWYPATLRKRILDIAAIRHRITFAEQDGMQVIAANASNRHAAFFVDPPYTTSKGKRAGSRLYLHSEINHESFLTWSNR